ncbi:hypothetical protein LCGC14_2414220, partial [marine sediment metagenome]
MGLEIYAGWGNSLITRWRDGPRKRYCSR